MLLEPCVLRVPSASRAIPPRSAATREKRSRVTSKMLSKPNRAALRGLPRPAGRTGELSLFSSFIYAPDAAPRLSPEEDDELVTWYTPLNILSIIGHECIMRSRDFRGYSKRMNTKG